MLSTGDVQGCLRRLETLLRAVKYPGRVDYNSLSKGDPSAFLPIVSFTLASFSAPFTEQLMAAGLELTGKTDLRFTDTLYKVLRDIFHYKPVLTKQQFLQWGFSQRKISIVCDIINLVLQKHNQLKKPSGRCLAPNKGSRGHVQPTLTDALGLPAQNLLNKKEQKSQLLKTTEEVSDQPVLVSHRESHNTSHLSSPHTETSSHSSPVNGIMEPAGDETEEEEEYPLNSAEVDKRLSSLENRLRGLLSGLERFGVLEKRLEDLERRTHSEKKGSDVVIVSRESWEDLMSRVVILETKVELRDTQLGVQPQCPLPSSSTMTDSSKLDLKGRLERITFMLQSTSTMLKNTEPSSTP